MPFIYSLVCIGYWYVWRINIEVQFGRDEMFNQGSLKLFVGCIFIYAMALFNACEHEIEYVEVIKEVPVEVIVRVPVYDRSEINRLNAQIISLRNQYERELSELRDIHRKEIEALNSLMYCLC